jgi:hypothetical protein
MSLQNMFKQRSIVVGVAIGMFVGFSSIMIKLSGVWPCDIIEYFGISLPQFC